MARLYADENVRFDLADALSALGHDVLTALDDGRAHQSIADPQVLARATHLGRAVLTNNRHDFHRLHNVAPAHAGIITYTLDRDTDALARRIHTALSGTPSVSGRLIRIIRPA